MRTLRWSRDCSIPTKLPTDPSFGRPGRLLKVSDEPAFHWLYFSLRSWLLGLPGGRQSHFQPGPAGGAREEEGRCPLMCGWGLTSQVPGISQIFLNLPPPCSLSNVGGVITAHLAFSESSLPSVARSLHPRESLKKVLFLWLANYLLRRFLSTRPADLSGNSFRG